MRFHHNLPGGELTPQLLSRDERCPECCWGEVSYLFPRGKYVADGGAHYDICCMHCGIVFDNDNPVAQLLNARRDRALLGERIKALIATVYGKERKTEGN